MPQVPAPRRRSADPVNDIRQQRKKKGGGVTDVLKTLAVCREIDLHSSLAKMLDDSVAESVLSSSRPRTARCCLRRTFSRMASSPCSQLQLVCFRPFRTDHYAWQVGEAQVTRKEEE